MIREKENDFAIRSDIPRKFTVMADFTADCFPLCIWAKGGGSSLDLWGFPEELCQRSREWLRRYFEDDPPPPGYTRERYNYEGRLITNEIKELLGEGYTISYRYILPWKDDCGDIVWEEEVI